LPRRGAYGCRTGFLSTYREFDTLPLRLPKLYRLGLSFCRDSRPGRCGQEGFYDATKLSRCVIDLPSVGCTGHGAHCSSRITRAPFEDQNVLNLSWVKCTGDNWCPFLAVNLSNVKTSGVYAIWIGGGQYIRVGQGDIAARITTHRNDSEITKHKNLYVTWASVPAGQRDGVERYLYDVCQPVVGDRAPDAPAIAVNLPGKS
jgi:hypothetical protein